MEENLVKAQSQYQIALRALSVAMGNYPKGELSVDGELVYKPFSFNLKSLIEEAFKNRAELKEIEVRFEQAKKSEEMAKGDFLPQVGAFGELFSADDSAPWNKENSSWVVGISATLNLFDGGKKFYQLKKSRVAQLKVKRLKERAKKGIAFEVSKAYYEFVSAQKRVELAKAALKSAQESLRIVEKRYRNGVANITELLDTQTALNQARSNFIAALSNYLTSVAKIYYATGTLPNRYRELTQ
jgi:outer membrane protein TolC